MLVEAYGNVLLLADLLKLEEDFLRVFLAFLLSNWTKYLSYWFLVLSLATKFLNDFQLGLRMALAIFDHFCK